MNVIPGQKINPNPMHFTAKIVALSFYHNCANMLSILQLRCILHSFQSKFRAIRVIKCVKTAC